MSYILWQPELLDNPAFCALMAESPEYLGLWFRCLQIANAAQRDGELCVFGGKPMTAKSLAVAHFRRADPSSMELTCGFLELATELGLLTQDGEHLSVSWWADFSKGLSETRDAWRQRKADQRARAKGEQSQAPPAPEPPSPPVLPPTETVSRDTPGTVTQSPQSNNQPTKQPNNQSINHPTARKPAANPAKPPLPEEAVATLERLRRHNEQAARSP